MINRKIIREAATSASYTKGLELYKVGKVLEYTVQTEEEGYEFVDALVKGSGRNRYQVTLEYNLEEDWLEEVFCDCPAFYSYSGVCKHCVAVMLEYADYSARQAAAAQDARKREESRNKLAGMKGMSGMARSGQVEAAPKTTPVIRELLGKRQEKRRLPVLQEELYGRVRLEPYLTFEKRGTLYVEFKIGASRMYVLQDVFAFLKALEHGEQREYGAKLNLVHSMEMFDQESQSLIRFLQEWRMRNMERYMQYSYYGGYSMSAMRNVPLTVMDLEGFLDAVGNQEFHAAIEGEKEELWKLTEEALPRVMKLTGKQDGVELEINKLSGFRGMNSYIYFIEGKVYRVPQSKLEPIGDFLAAMSEIPQRKAFIQKEDLPAFCRELLPELKKQFDCTMEQFDEHDCGIIPAAFEFYLDAPQADMITCKPMAVYGDKKFEVYGKAEENGLRDLVREMEIGKIVSSYCNAYDDVGRMMVAAQDEDRQYELLVQGIPRFQQLGEVFISDALKRINIYHAPKVSVGVRLSGDMLELSMTAGDMDREQLLEILSKYNRKKKYYQLKNGDFINMEKADLNVLLELKEGLQLTDTQMKKEMVTVPKYRAMYLDGELKEWQGVAAVKDKGFKNLIRNMKTVEDNDFEIPSHLSDVLREYQKRGFMWIKTLYHNGFGGILADDMGLGKTLQVITFLESEFAEAKEEENRRTLIVSPASLVFNWSSELQRFAPGLPVKMVVGTAAERREVIQNAGRREILLTSYDLLKRDIEAYEQVGFFCQVVDEAQYIKNQSTQVARAVKAVTAGFKLALTGTPVENRLSELWSIFDYLMPGFLFSYQRFKAELELPIVQNQDEAAMARLQKMIKPFVLRRLKGDVLTDLPEKLEKCVYARLTGEQQKLYDAHVKRMKLMLEKQSDEEFKTSKIQILSELTRLRQICCSPSLVFEEYEAESVKRDMCLDLIEQAISGGHKILLFSQFTSMLEQLQEQMKSRNIAFYVLTGAVSKEKRARMVEQFNQDETPVFCISLKAGGTGLNLTSADIVIHYDPWWNLAVQNQATDRAHRIGQKNAVMVYKLIVKGTIEENIMKLQEKKRELADQILSGEGMGSGSFSREELLELL